MRLLVIGGTVFLGRRFAESALKRGHQVTILHRGQHNPRLFAKAETLVADRDGGLQVLGNREWDAVLDTCGYYPRVVAQSASLLANRVERYLFVSSISAYGDVSRPGITEQDPVSPADESGVEEITGESYGPLKVACEQVVEQYLPGRTLVVRPGLIVGRDDVSDRFSYWPARIAQGGEVMAPGDKDAPVQLVDAADLGTWMVRLLEAGTSGTFNATGPATPLTMGGLLQECIAATGSDATLTWVDDKFLADQKVAPWSDMPLYIPKDANFAGFSAFDISRALGAGLMFRPLTETITETLAWIRTERGEAAWQAGITRERERELLNSWRQDRQPAPAGTTARC